MLKINDRGFLNNVKKMLNPPIKKIKKKESELFEIKKKPNNNNNKKKKYTK